MRYRYIQGFRCLKLLLMIAFALSFWFVFNIERKTHMIEYIYICIYKYVVICYDAKRFFLSLHAWMIIKMRHIIFEFNVMFIYLYINALIYDISFHVMRYRYMQRLRCSKLLLMTVLALSFWFLFNIERNTNMIVYVHICIHNNCYFLCCKTPLPCTREWL